MKTRTRKPPHDLRLKIAIIESRRTQRWLALATRIGEVRLSELVGRRGAPATQDEQERIAKHLDRPRADLFAPELLEPPVEDSALDADTARPA